MSLLLALQAVEEEEDEGAHGGGGDPGEGGSGKGEKSGQITGAWRYSPPRKDLLSDERADEKSLETAADLERLAAQIRTAEPKQVPVLTAKYSDLLMAQLTRDAQRQEEEQRAQQLAYEMAVRDALDFELVALNVAMLRIKRG